MMNDELITKSFYQTLSNSLNDIVNGDELTDKEYTVVHRMIEWCQSETPHYIDEFIDEMEIG